MGTIMRSDVLPIAVTALSPPRRRPSRWRVRRVLAANATGSTDVWRIVGWARRSHAQVFIFRRLYACCAAPISSCCLSNRFARFWLDDDYPGFPLLNAECTPHNRNPFKGLSAFARRALDAIHGFPSDLKHARRIHVAVLLGPVPLEKCVEPHMRHGGDHGQIKRSLVASLDVNVDVVGWEHYPLRWPKDHVASAAG